MDTNIIIQLVLGIVIILSSIIYIFVFAYMKVKGMAGDAVDKVEGYAEELKIKGEDKLVAAVGEVLRGLHPIFRLFITENVVRVLVQRAWELMQSYAEKQANKLGKKSK